MSNTPKTVLFVSHDASATGAPIFLLRFLQWFREHQDTPFRILVGSSGLLLPRFRSAGDVDLYEPEPGVFQRVLRRLKIDRVDTAEHLESLRKTLLEGNIGLIYANTVVSGKMLDFLSFLKCPVICHVHELEYAITHNVPMGLDTIDQHVSSYIAVSHAVRRNLVANHGIRAEKIQVVHGFIPTDENRRQLGQSVAVRRKLGIRSGSKLVCACGSIEPRKGTDLFLQVAGRMRAMCGSDTVHFVWVGGSRERLAETRKTVESLSLQDVVHFVGHQADVSAYYDAADVFLLPSREDPFPLVMLEAALHEKPVVCFSDSGGAPEFVEHDAGLVVEAFDVSAMANQLALLLDAEDCRIQMGIAARQKVLARHNIDISAPSIAALIQDALLSAEGDHGAPARRSRPAFV